MDRVASQFLQERVVMNDGICVYIARTTMSLLFDTLIYLMMCNFKIEHCCENYRVTHLLYHIKNVN